MLIRRYLPEDAYEAQKVYLEQINMDAHTFGHRLQHLIMMIKEFPRPEGVTLLSVHVFFRAMPTK
jgi:hypothetical protein